MAMLGIAAAVALLLSLVGIYGVVSYSVSQRTREIGVRMALGAQPAAVRALFLRHGFLLTSAGLVVGMAAGGALTRLMSALLFGISPLDLVTFTTVAAVLGLAAVLACYLPAQRASGVNPIEALRSE
jgi:ABC-type antimicrobial peptide transport system permease subunit